MKFIPARRRGRPLTTIITLVMVTLLLSPGSSAAADVQPPTADVSSTLLSFAPLPDSQPAAPRYEAEGLSGRFTFDRTGYMLTLDGEAEAVSVTMRFEGRGAMRLAPGEKRDGVINDLRGSDPSLWPTDAPIYGTLTYQQLYRGINLRYEGLPGRFKGTYTVAGGADPAQIRWQYQGAASVEIHRDTGELWVMLAGAPTEAAYLIEGAPLVWQEYGSRKVIVPARYQIDANGMIGYALGAHDTRRPLVIDPLVRYALIVGGSRPGTTSFR